MTIYRLNFYAQELQKRFYNKVVKPSSYASDKQVWLNSK